MHAYMDLDYTRRDAYKTYGLIDVADCRNAFFRFFFCFCHFFVFKSS